MKLVYATEKSIKKIHRKFQVNRPSKNREIVHIMKETEKDDH